MLGFLVLGLMSWCMLLTRHLLAKATEEPISKASLWASFAGQDTEEPREVVKTGSQQSRGGPGPGT